MEGRGFIVERSGVEEGKVGMVRGWWDGGRLERSEVVPVSSACGRWGVGVLQLRGDSEPISK